VFVGLNFLPSPTNNPLEKWQKPLVVPTAVRFHMGVSLNGGTPNSHPKMIILSRKTHGFVGETHHFRKHPYKHQLENAKPLVFSHGNPPIPFCQNRPFPPHPFSIFSQGTTPVTTSKKERMLPIEILKMGVQRPSSWWFQPS